MSGRKPKSDEQLNFDKVSFDTGNEFSDVGSRVDDDPRFSLYNYIPDDNNDDKDDDDYAKSIHALAQRQQESNPLIQQASSHQQGRPSQSGMFSNQERPQTNVPQKKSSFQFNNGGKGSAGPGS